jgi:hypothetical protein
MIPTNCALADSKAFRSAAAEFALAGVELHAEVCLDGATRLHAIHHGKVVPLDDLQHARVFLAQIGGEHA